MEKNTEKKAQISWKVSQFTKIFAEFSKLGIGET